MRALIRLYQRTLSPDHGLFRVFYPDGFCRYYPSCSEYAFQAITKFGFFRGWLLAIKRLLRCHPFNPPKVDPVPER